MDITIFPGKLRGEITVIPSKSQAHRLLICSAFADKPTYLLCSQTSRDMDATVSCLNSLGARISYDGQYYRITPVQTPTATTDLYCCDSGSTLRFLLPIVGALGVDATFHMTGRLPYRPLSPLWEEMERMGCNLSRPTETTLRCTGRLQAGEYSIDGGVSSQFITGLLFALSLLKDKSTLNISGVLESKPYVDMTLCALKSFGIDTTVLGGQQFHSPGKMIVEGDWSNGAFFLAANALESDICVLGLEQDSPQGDRACNSLFQMLQAQSVTIDAKDIPDLVPILAVVAGASHGAIFENIRRLRLKESDRVESVIQMFTSLGGKAEATEDTLTVYPTGYRGGTVDSAGDHRIAMAAAIAATVCQQPVTIHGAEAVNKSYPQFLEEYRRLGGNYE